MLSRYCKPRKCLAFAVSLVATFQIAKYSIFSTGSYKIKMGKIQNSQETAYMYERKLIEGFNEPFISCNHLLLQQLKFLPSVFQVFSSTVHHVLEGVQLEQMGES